LQDKKCRKNWFSLFFIQNRLNQSWNKRVLMMRVNSAVRKVRRWKWNKSRKQAKRISRKRIKMNMRLKSLMKMMRKPNKRNLIKKRCQ
jgi:hypothetical protein